MHKKNNDLIVLVLAAGKGVRMESDLPKVLHQAFNKPLIKYVLDSVFAVFPKDVFVVVGYKKDLIISAVNEYPVKYVEQKDQLGTGHAVKQVEPNLKDFNGMVLVTNGDMPLISAGTIQALINYHKIQASCATVLTAELEDPASLGRIVRDGKGNIEKIVEKKDAQKSELLIKEINTGTYCFQAQDLFSALDRVRAENNQKEYYLTDVIGILKQEGNKVAAFKTSDSSEAEGVTTKDDLVRIEKLLALRCG